MYAANPKYLFTTLISFSFFALTACSNSANTANEKTEQPPAEENNTTQVEAETIDTSLPEFIVSTDRYYKPFEFRDDQGKITGFDIDLVNAIAADQNFRVTYIMTPFEQQIDGLINGKYDMVVAGMTITDERKQKVDFSDAYFTAKQAVVALPDSPPISSFDALTAHKVAVKSDTTSDELLHNQLKMSPDDILHVETLYKGFEAVIQKKADYLMSDAPALSYTNKEFKQFDLKVYVDENSKPEYYGIAFAKNHDDDLVEKVNTGLKNIKENGTYESIYNKWF